MNTPKSLDDNMNNFEMMFAEDTAIVVISGNKDSQAKIMKTNNGITKLIDSMLNEINKDYFDSVRKAIMDYILKDENEMRRLGIQ